MTTPPAPYRVDIRIRNNALLSRIKASGKTVAALCHEAGVHPTCFYKHARVTTSPLTPSGEWRTVPLRIARALGTDPAELWPEAWEQEGFKTDRVSVPCSRAELRALAGNFAPPPALPSARLDAAETAAVLDSALATLSPRERDIISRYFGLGDHEPETFAAIGASQDRSIERIRQIAYKGIDKLRRAMLTDAAAEAAGLEPLRLTR